MCNGAVIDVHRGVHTFNMPFYLEDIVMPYLYSVVSGGVSLGRRTGELAHHEICSGEETNSMSFQSCCPLCAFVHMVLRDNAIIAFSSESLLVINTELRCILSNYEGIRSWSLK